jgi:hypothetical protein
MKPFPPLLFSVNTFLLSSLLILICSPLPILVWLYKGQIWIPQKSWNNSFFPNQLCKDSSHQSHLHKDEDALGLRLLDLPFILGIGIWVGSVLLGGLFVVKVDGEEIGQGCTFCWLRGPGAKDGRIFRAFFKLGTRGISEPFLVGEQWGSRPSFSLCCLPFGPLLF